MSLRPPAPAPSSPTSSFAGFAVWRRRGLELVEEPGEGSHRKVRPGKASDGGADTRDILTGTWRAILKQLGLTPDDLA